MATSGYCHNFPQSLRRLPSTFANSNWNHSTVNPSTRANQDPEQGQWPTSSQNCKHSALFSSKGQAYLLSRQQPGHTNASPILSKQLQAQSHTPPNCLTSRCLNSVNAGTTFEDVFRVQIKYSAPHNYWAIQVLLLRKPKIHHRVQKTSVHRTLPWANLVQSRQLHHISLTFILILSFFLLLGHFPVRVTWPAQLTGLVLNVIILQECYVNAKDCENSLRNSVRPPVTFL
jgi:hypothetical protein